MEIWGISPALLLLALAVLLTVGATWLLAHAQAHATRGDPPPPDDRPPDRPPPL